MHYQYFMVQAPRTIAVQANVQRGQEAAGYLQNLVNQYAREGWEFYRVDSIGVVITQGCCAMFFGAKESMTEYYVVTFRREV